MHDVIPLETLGETLVDRDQADDEQVASIGISPPRETSDLARIGLAMAPWGPCSGLDNLSSGCRCRERVSSSPSCARAVDTSAVSGNVCAFYQLTEGFVVSVSVAPDDVAADHRVLLLV